MKTEVVREDSLESRDPNLVLSKKAEVDSR